MNNEINVFEYGKKLGLAIDVDDLIGHEDNVGENLIVPILKSLGYKKNDIVRKPRVIHTIISKSGLEPDYGIYPYGERKYKHKGKEITTDEYGIVVDTKRYKRTLTKEMEEKLAGYCGLTGAYCGILSNGEKIVVIKPTRGVIEWEYLDYIPSKSEIEQILKKTEIKYKDMDITYAKRVTRELTEKEIEDIAEKCHNIIRSRKGMAVPERLYEFSKLIISRIVDERRYKEGEQKELLITLENLNSMKGKKQTIKTYIKNIIDTIRDEIGIFEKDETVELEDDVIEEIIEYLDDYPLWSEKIDILGHVYEKFLMNTMTGRELGGYFTPRPIVDKLVEMVSPSIGDTILDPACGSGGFLISPLMYLKKKYGIDDEKQVKKIASNFYGMDIFDIITKLCQINLWLHGDCHDNISRTDSLEPSRNTPDIIIDALIDPAEKGFDLILTNPPFGAKEGNRITVSRMKEINKKWKERLKEEFEKRKIKEKDINLFECAIGSKGNITLQPQVPFIELCIKLLKEPKNIGGGGRLGIVIDNGILSNTIEEAPVIRNIINKYCIIEAIVGLPKGIFKAYGSNVIPSFLILRRKHQDEKQGAIFRAEATKVGLVPGRTRYIEDSKEDLEKILEVWKSRFDFNKKGLTIYDHQLPIWGIDIPSSWKLNTDTRLDNNYFHPAYIIAKSHIDELEKSGKFEVKTLSEIYKELNSGISPSSDGEIPVIEGGNVQPNYIFPSFYKYGNKNKNNENLLVKENDLLIVKDGSPSTVAYISKKLLEHFDEIFTSYHVYIIRPKDKYKRYIPFISSFLNSKVGQAIIRRYISGSVSPTIRDNEIGEVEVIIPKDVELAERFAKELNEFQETVILSRKFMKYSKFIDDNYGIKDIPRLPINWLPGGKRDKQEYYKD